ncbi:MAG: pseudouridine synthase [Candidatus Methylacidiphilales bacterium]|nr:RluA family pseudouridine synthase [Candidatus Methylacidiphilales bacterium]
MPAPITVTQPAELLPLMFATWTDVKKKQVRTWLKNQAVTVNGRAITQFNHALKKGDVVDVRTDRTAAPDSMMQGGRGAGAIKIRHEDDTIIVIEKPSGLLSIANEEEREKTAYFLLNEYLREKSNRFDRERVWIVHRLDRETSGLMVFAKSEEAKRALQDDWEHVEKQYFAVVDDSPLPQRPLGGSKAKPLTQADEDIDFDDDDDEDDDDSGAKPKMYLTRLVEGSAVPGPIAGSATGAVASAAPAEKAVKAERAIRGGRPRNAEGPPRAPGSTGSLESYLDESHPYRVRSGKPGSQTRYALTHYKVLQRKGIRSVLELTLRTGRRHQIRVHLSESGWSILGDPKYGTAGDKARRMALHSCTLRFTHPGTKAPMEFLSPLPPELSRLLSYGSNASSPSTAPSPSASAPASSKSKSNPKPKPKPKSSPAPSPSRSAGAPAGPRPPTRSGSDRGSKGGGTNSARTKPRKP